MQTPPVHTPRKIGWEVQSVPPLFVFFYFIACRMQIVAVVAMHARLYRLAVHDAHTIRMRLSHARHATCPDDVVAQDMPRLTHDDARTVRMRLSHARHATCPHDVVAQGMPRLTHDDAHTVRMWLSHARHATCLDDVVAHDMPRLTHHEHAPFTCGYHMHAM
jgi:hypothetical protein